MLEFIVWRNVVVSFNILSCKGELLSLINIFEFLSTLIGIGSGDGCGGASYIVNINYIK